MFVERVGMTASTDDKPTLKCVCAPYCESLTVLDSNRLILLDIGKGDLEAFLMSSGKGMYSDSGD